MQHLTLVAATLLFAADKEDAPPKIDPAVVRELQKLQGTWKVEAWEEGGKPLAAGELAKRGVFFGANAFVIRRGEKLVQVSLAQIAPAKTPRTMNLAVKEGEGKDGVMLGIYSLDGDTLKLCYDPQGESRPKDFKPGAKAGCILITLKKPKPPADEAVEITGEYRSEMTDAGGKVVVTDVQIERRGDSYLVTYRQEDRILFAGTALRRGNQLSMSWVSAGQTGVSVYKIEGGGKLTGEYTILGGIGMTAKETLTRKKVAA